MYKELYLDIRGGTVAQWFVLLPRTCENRVQVIPGYLLPSQDGFQTHTNPNKTSRAHKMVGYEDVSAIQIVFLSKDLSAPALLVCGLKPQTLEITFSSNVIFQYFCVHTKEDYDRCMSAINTVDRWQSEKHGCLSLEFIS